MNTEQQIAQIVAKHAHMLPHVPLLDLLRFGNAVASASYLAGQRDGIRETAQNARRMFVQVMP